MSVYDVTINNFGMVRFSKVTMFLHVFFIYNNSSFNLLRNLLQNIQMEKSIAIFLVNILSQKIIECIKGHYIAFLKRL